MRSSLGCSIFYLVIVLSCNYFLASSTAKSAPAPLPPVDLTVNTSDNTIEKYQAAIEEIEYQDGAYGSKLTQELLNLGTAYQHHDRHDDALKILNRSLHLSRINDGLYSPGQIPILEKIIQSLKELKQWESVNDRYYYQYWLYIKNFGKNDIKMLDIQLKMAYWYLHAYSLKLSPNSTQDLLNSFTLFDKVAQLITITYSENDIRLVEALNGLMIANYFMATLEPTARPEVASEFASNGQVKLINTTNKIEHMKSKSYNTGRDIIEREIKILSNQSTTDYLDITKAMLKLADWHLMYNKEQRAVAQYREAYHYAITNDRDNKSITELFTQPVALPDFPNLKSNTSVSPDDSVLAGDVKYVHATFNVTRFGKVKNIKIINSNPPDNVGMRARVIRNLRIAKFRPRISDGVPVLTEHTQIHVIVN